MNIIEMLFARKSRYGILEPDNEPAPKVPDIILSQTIGAAQRNWKTVSEFPCCPAQYGDAPIAAYFKNLEAGAVFCRNEVYTSVVSKSVMVDNCSSIYVLTKCKDGIKRWALARITFESEMLVHTSIQTFFSPEDAEKGYTLAQGLEWTRVIQSTTIVKRPSLRILS